MPIHSPIRRPSPQLVGRSSERHVLDQLIEAVRAGESRALVVSGEPGVGKTALLEYIVEQASGCRVARAGGVQSEMVLAFAARRLDAESVGLIFAARSPSDALAGLPDMVVAGLREADARALLDSVLTGSLRALSCDRARGGSVQAR